MDPRIAVLTPRDFPTLRRMLNLFGREFEDTLAYSTRQPDDLYLARLLGSDTFIAIAALEGEQVVGGLAGYVCPSLSSRGRSSTFMTWRSPAHIAGRASPRR